MPAAAPPAFSSIFPVAPLQRSHGDGWLPAERITLRRLRARSLPAGNGGGLRGSIIGALSPPDTSSSSAVGSALFPLSRPSSTSFPLSDRGGSPSLLDSVGRDRSRLSPSLDVPGHSLPPPPVRVVGHPVRSSACAAVCRPARILLGTTTGSARGRIYMAAPWWWRRDCTDGRRRGWVRAVTAVVSHAGTVAGLAARWLLVGVTTWPAVPPPARGVARLEASRQGTCGRRSRLQPGALPVSRPPGRGYSPGAPMTKVVKQAGDD
jgi:hypothetical protein